MKPKFNQIEFIFISQILNHVEIKRKIIKKIYISVLDKSIFNLKFLSYILMYFFNDMDYYKKEYNSIVNNKYKSKYNLIEFLKIHNYNTDYLNECLNSRFLTLKQFSYLYKLSKNNLVKDYFNNINKLKKYINSVHCKSIVNKEKPVFKDYYIRSNQNKILLKSGNEIKKIKVLTL